MYFLAHNDVVILVTQLAALTLSRQELGTDLAAFSRVAFDSHSADTWRPKTQQSKMKPNQDVDTCKYV